LRWRS